MAKKPKVPKPKVAQPDDLAQRLKVLRETMGWSISECARRFGVSRSAVSQWESGAHLSGPAIKLLEVFEKKATKFEES